MFELLRSRFRALGHVLGDVCIWHSNLDASLVEAARVGLPLAATAELTTCWPDTADDAGIAARLAKKLLAWTPQDAGKLEVRHAVVRDRTPQSTDRSGGTQSFHPSSAVSWASFVSLACYDSCVADILLNNWNCVEQLDFCLYLQVIRPGTFTAQYIRSTGLKNPVLIKGDRFNESPQLGLMWPDVDNITVDILLHFIGGDRKASLTWSKQVTLLTKWHTVSCG